MSVNKSFLHKQTGDKESYRRGQYLKKLFNQNALGTNKTLLTNFQQAPSIVRGQANLVDQATGSGYQSIENIVQKQLDLAVGPHVQGPWMVESLDEKGNIIGSQFNPYSSKAISNTGQLPNILDQIALSNMSDQQQKRLLQCQISPKKNLKQIQMTQAQLFDPLSQISPKNFPHQNSNFGRQDRFSFQNLGQAEHLHNAMIKVKATGQNGLIEPISPEIHGNTVENRYSKSLIYSGDSISNSQASEKLLMTKKNTGFNLTSNFQANQTALLSSSQLNNQASAQAMRINLLHYTNSKGHRINSQHAVSPST